MYISFLEILRQIADSVVKEKIFQQISAPFPFVSLEPNYILKKSRFGISKSCTWSFKIDFLDQIVLGGEANGIVSGPDCVESVKPRKKSKWEDEGRGGGAPLSLMLSLAEQRVGSC